MADAQAFFERVVGPLVAGVAPRPNVTTGGANQTPIGGALPADLDLVPDEDVAEEELAEDLFDGNEWVGTELIDVPAGGWETVACYAPYHFARDKWGIYYFERPVIGLARGLLLTTRARPYRVSDLRDCLGLVVRILAAHERFHFRVEFAAAHAQNVLGKTLYPDYFDKSYKAIFNTPDCIEEALATAEEVRSARRADRAVGAWFADMSDRSPDGYKQYRDYMDRRAEVAGFAKLLARVLAMKSVDGESLSAAGSRAYYSSIPTFWVPDPKTSPALRDLILPKIIPLNKRKVVKHARSRGGHVEPGGGHQEYVVYGNGRVPLSRGWKDTIPEFAVKQLATLFGLSAGKYVEEVLSRA